MRGFMLTAFFFILFIFTAITVSYLVGGLQIVEHPTFRAHLFDYGTAMASLHGVKGDCYLDINTFGALDRLDLPEGKRC